MESRWIARKLSNLGYRLTPQRLMVLQAVEEADGHISADEIFARVSARYPNLNISTVYRTLELLKEQGLATETDFGDGRVRYHCSGKGHHHHLVCEKCGRIIDVEEAFLSPVWQSIRDRFQFNVRMKHMAFFGLCEQCRPE